jgi:1-aminocyclopropane-1-carboxylate deaminase/D-cysteine desulfhydrase-like pyridoxal-dependent ACC family enzyme
MDNLGALVGLEPGRLQVKRDDLTGLAGGGNKARKLQHLCADAVDRGCDVLVTGGAAQSNHVRMTAGAANLLGLDCVVVLAGREREQPTGNVVLHHLLGARMVWAGPLDYYGLEAAIDDEAQRLLAAGRHPYAVPIGGASTVGALGYVDAALELREQLPDLSLVVVADGSGGSHAGLVAGLGSHDLVLGVDAGTRPDLDDVVPATAAETATLTGLPAPSGAVRIDHAHFGDAYGAPTDSCREALDLAARCEGLLLDPVYTGKAMAGLLTVARDGGLPASGSVCFLHTGGLPSIFEPRYGTWVRDGVRRSR